MHHSHSMPCCVAVFACRCAGVLDRSRAISRNLQPLQEIGDTLTPVSDLCWMDAGETIEENTCVMLIGYYTPYAKRSANLFLYCGWGKHIMRSRYRYGVGEDMISRRVYMI